MNRMLNFNKPSFLNLGLGLGLSIFAASVVAGCGKGDDTAAPVAKADGGTTNSLSGSIGIDGSTTVYPIVQIMAEDFGKANSGVKVTVNKAGTGSGFQKFLRGETDIATASRPIEDKELEQATSKGVEFIEIPIAFDGVTVLVNPENSWASSMTLDELKKAWGPDSTVKTWKDINPAWPADAITFVGPTDNHGTYEYFTEAVNGKKNQIRKEYQPNQEYTSIIQAVAGDKNTIGYSGINYYEENKDQVKAVSVNGVLPGKDTIIDGTYKPLSRPLFIYVSKKAFARPEVKAFLDYALGEGLGAVEEASYVKLPDDAYASVKKRVEAGKAGSVFQGVQPGTKIGDILAKENSN